VPGLFAKAASRLGRFGATLVRTRTVRMVNERPIVSFSFDDFPKSAVRNAAAILERHGVAGTYYLSRSFNGRTVDGIDYYELADLRRLLDNGHEIGCHTGSHLHATRVGRSRLLEDIETNAEFVREHFGDVRMSTFAFPFGDMNLPTKLLLQDRFAACRSNVPGINRCVADLGALRAARIYSRSTNVEALTALIKRSAQPSSWLILYTHDVDDDPSPYGCSVTLFQAAVRSALAAGFQILPVRNALGTIRFRANTKGSVS
jgi:peptidoglycan/xylan/chitin deacetylase (PgdA/CDA1 family)